MATFPDNLCTELECVVCKEVFIDPVTLPCQHHFCRRCLIAEFFHNVPESHNPDWSMLCCPSCGKTQLTSVPIIKKLPIDLKLRNIIDSLTGLRDRCRLHKKELQLFCCSCQEGKCLTCFIRDCSKQGHCADDLQQSAKRARIRVREKLDYVDDQLKVATGGKIEKKTEVVAKLRQMLSPEWSYLLDKIEHLLSKLIADEMRKNKSAFDKLKLALTCSDAELVKAELNMEAPTVPPSNIILSELTTMSEAIDGSLEQLKGQLLAHGIDVDKPLVQQTVRQRPPVQTLTDNVEELPTIDTFSYVGNWVQDHESLRNTTLAQALAVDGTLSVAAKPAVVVDGIARMLTPLTHLTFSGSLVNSVSFLWPDNSFTANTSDGCLRIGSSVEASVRSFCGKFVKAACVIPTRKVLMLIRNSLHIYEIKEPSEREQIPVYTIPNSTKLVQGYEFDCIGVISSDSPSYVVTEKRTATIQVWNTEKRQWGRTIEMSSLTGKNPSQLSFKMCTSKLEIYTAVFNVGEIRCMNVCGETKWVNRQACRKPNGLAVDEENLYVCEGEKFISSVVVLNQEVGLRLYVITSSILQRPFAIAAGNGQLAVLERYFKHNVMISPINLYLFDVSSLRNIEEP